MAVGAVDSASMGDAVVARLERLPFSKIHKRVMVILSTGTFFDSYDTLAIGSALTVIFTTLHIDLVSTGLLLGLAYIGQLVGAILFGMMSEVWGRKKAYIVSLLIMGAFSLASALAWNFGSLLAFRVLAGIGLGGEVPVAGAMMTEFVRAHRRGRHFFVYQTLYSWGAFITPLVGFVLISSLGPEKGWRWLLGIGCLPVVLAAISLWLLPESVRWLVDKGRTEQADSIVAAMENDLASRGIALEPVHVRAHADVKPTRFTELFDKNYRRRTALSWLQWFFCYIVTVGTVVWLPSLLVRVGHLTPTQSLQLTVLVNVCMLTGAYITAFGLIDRLGRRRTFTLGFAGMAFGAFVGLVEVSVFHVQSWVALFVAACLIQFSVTLNAQGAYLYTSELFPTRMRGWAASTGRGVGLIASIVAPIAVGSILNSKLGVVGMFSLFTLMAVLGIITILSLGIETKGQTLEEVSH
jgi:MFS transporter, putative metabolite:H+ symporter